MEKSETNVLTLAKPDWKTSLTKLWSWRLTWYLMVILYFIVAILFFFLIFLKSQAHTSDNAPVVSETPSITTTGAESLEERYNRQQEILKMPEMTCVPLKRPERLGDQVLLSPTDELRNKINNDRMIFSQVCPSFGGYCEYGFTCVTDKVVNETIEVEGKPSEKAKHMIVTYKLQIPKANSCRCIVDKNFVAPLFRRRIKV